MPVLRTIETTLGLSVCTTTPGRAGKASRQVEWAWCKTNCWFRSYTTCSRRHSACTKMSDYGEASALCWKPARATFIIPPGRSDHEAGKTPGKAYAGPVRLLSTVTTYGQTCVWSWCNTQSNDEACLNPFTSAAGFDNIPKVDLSGPQLLADS